MSTSTERTRQLRQERRELGLCPQCGDRPPAEGRAVCGVCLEVNRLRGKAKRENSILNGKCPDCGGPSKRVEVTVIFRKRRRFADGRCRRCTRRNAINGLSS